MYNWVTTSRTVFMTTDIFLDIFTKPTSWDHVENLLTQMIDVVTLFILHMGPGPRDSITHNIYILHLGVLTIRNLIQCIKNKYHTCITFIPPIIHIHHFCTCMGPTIYFYSHRETKKKPKLFLDAWIVSIFFLKFYNKKILLKSAGSNY